MAVLDYIDTTNAATVEQWNRVLNTQLVLKDHIMLRTGVGWAEEVPKGRLPTKAICYDTNLQGSNGGRGDTVTHHMTTALQHAGAAGLESLEGKEAKPNLATWNYKIDVFRGGIRDETPMNKQRVAVEWVKNMVPHLVRWVTRRKFFAALAHMAGYEGTVNSSVVDDSNLPMDFTQAKWNINNSIVTTANSCWTLAGSTPTANTTDQAVEAETTSARPTLAQFEQLVLDIKKRRHPLQPFLDTPYGPCWPILVDSAVMFRILQDTNFRAIYQQNALQGGFIKENPMFTGAQGVVEGLMFFEVYRGLPWGFHSTTKAPISSVRRCIVLGVDALNISYGLDYSPSRQASIRSKEEDLMAVLWHAFSICGMSRPQFTDPNDSIAYDIGTHVWSVYVD